MDILLTAVKRREKAKRMTVSLVFVGDDGQTEGKELDVLEAMWPQDVPMPAEDGDAAAFPVILEKFGADALLYADEVSRAVMKGADLLDYADQPAKALLAKLERRGFRREAAEEAVSYLEKRGMLREEDLMRAYLETLYERKKLGPARMAPELLRHGFSLSRYREAFDDAVGAMDFDRTLDERLQKTSRSALRDPAARQKTAAALARAGFSASSIRRAFDRAEDRDDE